MVRKNAQSLQRQQADINREVADVVNIINSLGSQIQALNLQIVKFEMDGSNANDLRDQRNLLIDNLSQYVNVQVEERDFSRPGIPIDRRTTVMINGQDFINHDFISRLQIHPRPAGSERNEMDVVGLYDISIGSAPFNIYSSTLSGQLRGLIDVRDGNNGVSTTLNQAGAPYRTNNFKGIPFYMNQLNHLVRTFASAINEGRNAQGELIPGTLGHIFGYNGNGQNLSTMMFTFQRSDSDLYADVEHLRLWLLDDGTTSDAATPPANVQTDDYGNPIFVLDMSQMNALNFTVNPQLLLDPAYLAASSNHNLGQANNDVILGFGVINNDRSLFREGRLIDFIIATSNHLAVDNNQARNFRLSYNEITMQTHNHRLSIKGVDSNEEMMQLIRFQTMFTAASRLVNVLDSVYDTLINRLGNI
jgi:flagellar hook-associated protein 1 FlgK